MNLLKETHDALRQAGKTPEDVDWVGSQCGTYSVTFHEFELIASTVDYNNGFGDQLIAADLVVVGNGWWLERWEYDGSEGWDFKTTPVKLAGNSFSCVGPRGSWQKLHDLNT